MRFRSVAYFSLLSVVLTLPLSAQQTGASLTGHVTDPTGSVIAGAKIEVKSTSTGSVYTTESDTAGIYRLPFVAIGEYTLTVEKTGFKTYVQQGITLVIDQKVTLDVTMELGAVSQSITVVGNAPLLQAESADRGFTVDQTLLPLKALSMLNTFEATFQAPGEAFSNSSEYELGMGPGTASNGGMSGGIFNGGIAGNNYMVDGITSGAPGTRGGTITTNGNAWNPSSDAVQEISVQSTMYDAQYGWSSGGAVNTITKSGTNTWHGDAFEYNTNTALMAATYSEDVNHLHKSPYHINQYGVSAGGPILKNKLFAFYALENFTEWVPYSFTSAVPTAAEIQGNFSGLYTNSAKTTQVLLYDPTTTTLCPAAVAWCTGVPNGTYARETFSAEYGTNNTIPANLLNPVALNVLKFLPLPNHPNGYNDAGNLVNLGQDRENNTDVTQETGRADLNLSDKTHAFFRYSLVGYGLYKNFLYSTPSNINPADTTINDPLLRENQSFTLQVVRTLSPTTVLQVRTGMERYVSSPGGGGEGANFNLSTLGFSQTFLSEATPWFPDFTWSSYGGAGTVGPTGFQASPTFVTEGVLATTHNEHNLKVGFQNYVTEQNVLNPGNVAGAFGFTGVYTTANPTSQTAATGNSIADFLLGDANTGDIQVQRSPAYAMKQYSLFVQDDYHLSKRLTLNMGLRWDYQGSITERINAVLRGFCTTCASPLEVPNYPLLGGPLFAGVAPNPRNIYNPKYANFGPRIGFAYNLGHDTVVRGGYGMIYASIFLTPGVAPGFGQTTNMLTSIQTGIPNPAVTLQNPFPTGILTPVGAKYGLAANVGNSITYADPDMNIPRTQQYSFEVQHQFGHNYLVTIGYVGTHGARLPATQSLDAVPLADLPYTYSFATNPSGLTAAQLNSNVANPFAAVPSSSPYYSIMTGTYLSPANATITQYHLTYPFPQFSAVSEEYEPIGGTRYNSLQAEFNKRLSNGLTFSSNFTWSKTTQAITFLNAEDAQPAWSIYQYDIPKKLNVNMAYYLPFGRGKQFLTSAGPVVGHLVEGWTWGASTTLMTGFPIATPSGVMPTGASETVPNPTLAQWFNSCTENAAGTATVNCPSGITTPAWRTTVAYQLQTWSPYLANIRTPGWKEVEMSLSKKTKITERFDFVLRADFHNAFNSLAWFGGPDTNSTDSTFGTIAPAYSTPSSDPRTIVISGRLIF